MEYLNSIQIRGKVGAVRLSSVSGKKVANFSVCTEYVSKDKEGNVICELTWHQVVCWQSKRCFELEELYKGQNVYVEGRLRQIRYTSSSGEEKIMYEILASRLETVKD